MLTEVARFPSLLKAFAGSLIVLVLVTFSFLIWAWGLLSLSEETFRKRLDSLGMRHGDLKAWRAPEKVTPYFMFDPGGRVWLQSSDKVILGPCAVSLLCS